MSSFGVNPNTVYSMNINLGLDPSKTQYRTVTTADHYDVTPTYRFDDLTFEHKLELLDLVDDYAFGNSVSHGHRLTLEYKTILIRKKMMITHIK